MKNTNEKIDFVPRKIRDGWYISQDMSSKFRHSLWMAKKLAKKILKNTESVLKHF